MVLIAVALLLTGIALFLWGMYSLWLRPARAMAAVAGGFVVLGLAWGLLHAIGREGF